jgi:Flp pilus assembly protein TadD
MIHHRKRLIVSIARLVFAVMWVVLWLVAPETARAHGAYHDLVRQLTVALKESPDDPNLHFRLACAHQEHKELQLALTELARVDELAPGRFQTQLIRGIVYADAGRWEEARVQLDAVLANDSDSFRALSERALVRLELNQPTNAVADGRKAMALGGSTIPDFYTRWARALQKHHLSDEALNAAQQGLNKFANDPELLNLAFELELAQKDYDAALKRISALKKIWPVPEVWMCRTAEVLTTAGRSEDARVAWEELRTHVQKLPSLQRSTPHMSEILARSEKALGLRVSTLVLAPPTATSDHR